MQGRHSKNPENWAEVMWASDSHQQLNSCRNKLVTYVKASTGPLGGVMGGTAWPQEGEEEGNESEVARR